MRILFAWKKDDVIEANIKSLFRQGAEQAFLIDSGGKDDTARLARRAGTGRVR